MIFKQKKGIHYNLCINEQLNRDETWKWKSRGTYHFLLCKGYVQRWNINEGGDLGNILSSWICSCPAHLSVMLAKGPQCQSSGLNINGIQNPGLFLFLFLLSCKLISTWGWLTFQTPLHNVSKLKSKIWEKSLEGSSQRWGLCIWTIRNCTKKYYSLFPFPLNVASARMKAADFCFEFSPLTKGLHRIATQIWKALKSAGELPRG